MENEVKRMEMDQKDCSLKVEKLIENMLGLHLRCNFLVELAQIMTLSPVILTRLGKTLKNCKLSNLGVN
ncbi:UNVERIFIED_CONTAM: hypothetical protein Sradi_6498200 [Sesamum radiatum]|uniref:Uncharacterized protein n=1 Tax=Sesamum radiatum TaxID=300843 RepID=A0AAW2JUU4_SESRA